MGHLSLLHSQGRLREEYLLDLSKSGHLSQLLSLGMYLLDLTNSDHLSQLLSREEFHLVQISNDRIITSDLLSQLLSQDEYLLAQAKVRLTQIHKGRSNLHLSLGRASIKYRKMKRGGHQQLVHPQIHDPVMSTMIMQRNPVHFQVLSHT